MRMSSGRGHTEIEKYTVDGTREAALLEDAGQAVEARVFEVDARLLRKDGFSVGDSLGIAINREQPSSGRKPRQQFCCVATAPEGGIDISPAGICHEVFHGLLQQNRLMHIAPPQDD
jgi:hypothetical protein